MANLFKEVKARVAQVSLVCLQSRMYYHYLNDAKWHAGNGFLSLMRDDLAHAAAIKPIPPETRLGISITGHSRAAREAEKNAKIYAANPQEYLAEAGVHRLIVTRLTEQLGELRSKKR